MKEVDKTMCPLLTCAAGKARPCAGGGCAWFVDSFDPRYSRCVLMDIDAAAQRLLLIAKRSQG